MAVNNLAIILLIISILNCISLEVTTAASISSESIIDGTNSLQNSKSNSIDSTYPQGDQVDLDYFFSQMFMLPKNYHPKLQTTGDNILSNQMNLRPTAR